MAPTATGWSFVNVDVLYLVWPRPKCKRGDRSAARRQGPGAACTSGDPSPTGVSELIATAPPKCRPICTPHGDLLASKTHNRKFPASLGDRDFRTMVRGVSWNSRWASCAGWLRRVLATTRDSSPRYPGEPFALPHARLSKRIDRNAPHSGGVHRPDKRGSQLKRGH